MALYPTTLETQIDQSHHDPLRVLVVGAGIAGLTAAQLLRRAGLHPIVVERAGPEADDGYMLALMPMVEAALRDLDVWEPYRNASTALHRFRLRSRTGAVLRTDSMTSMLQRYGDYRGISRGRLMEVLTHAGAPVTFGTTVGALHESSDAVEVTTSDGERTTTIQVDAVVISDGIGSRTRDLVLHQPCARVDTGWGGWVVWAPPGEETDVGTELWGAGFFLGRYPVLGQDGIFLGGPAPATATGPQRFADSVQERLRNPDPPVTQALQAVRGAPERFYWPLQDVRVPRWTTGRTVLLGDAGAGFLPTAGIGAGMAMESSWVLARMIQTLLLETPRVPSGAALARILSAYEHLQRPRVEKAQDNSRALARLMFRTSRPVAFGREVALRIMNVEQALRPIQKLLASPPRPDEAAREALEASTATPGPSR